MPRNWIALAMGLGFLVQLLVQVWELANLGTLPHPPDANTVKNLVILIITPTAILTCLFIYRSALVYGKRPSLWVSSMGLGCCFCVAGFLLPGHVGHQLAAGIGNAEQVADEAQRFNAMLILALTVWFSFTIRDAWLVHSRNLKKRLRRLEWARRRMVEEALERQAAAQQGTRPTTSP